MCKQLPNLLPNFDSMGLRQHCTASRDAGTYAEAWYSSLESGNVRNDRSYAQERTSIEAELLFMTPEVDGWSQKLCKSPVEFGL